MLLEMATKYDSNIQKIIELRDLIVKQNTDEYEPLISNPEKIEQLPEEKREQAHLYKRWKIERKIRDNGSLGGEIIYDNLLKGKLQNVPKEMLNNEEFDKKVLEVMQNSKKDTGKKRSLEGGDNEEDDDKYVPTLTDRNVRKSSISSNSDSTNENGSSNRSLSSGESSSDIRANDETTSNEQGSIEKMNPAPDYNNSEDDDSDYEPMITHVLRSDQGTSSTQELQASKPFPPSAKSFKNANLPTKPSPSVIPSITTNYGTPPPPNPQQNQIGQPGFSSVQAQSMFPIAPFYSPQAYNNNQIPVQFYSPQPQQTQFQPSYGAPSHPSVPHSYHRYPQRKKRYKRNKTEDIRNQSSFPNDDLGGLY